MFLTVTMLTVAGWTASGRWKPLAFCTRKYLTPMFTNIVKCHIHIRMEIDTPSHSDPRVSEPEKAIEQQSRSLVVN
ncbi:unnamed protein product [Arctogadus glacialis]